MIPHLEDLQYVIGTRRHDSVCMWKFPAICERDSPGTIVIIGDELVDILRRQTAVMFRVDAGLHQFFGVLGVFDTAKISRTVTQFQVECSVRLLNEHH